MLSTSSYTTGNHDDKEFGKGQMLPGVSGPRIYMSMSLLRVRFYREKIHPIAESKAPNCGSRASSCQ